MGRLFEVSCRQCAAVSEQLDGPLMSGFLPRCLGCGQTTSVTITDLVADEPPELDPASTEARARRYARIPTLACACAECGGRFDLDAPLRCPECRSTDVSAVKIAIVD